jgi:hypothetical protein
MHTTMFLFFLAVTTTVNALTCPVLTAKEDPSKVKSIEPICVKYDEMTLEPPQAVEDVIARENTLDPIIAGALGGEAASADTVTAYITGIVLFAAFPFVMCMCNGCSGFCHCFARIIAQLLCPTSCCFACCMCRPRTNKPYEKAEKLWPVALWMGFSLACVITAIYGTSGGTGQFQPTFVRGSCLVDTTRVKITTFIDQFKKPVVAFKDKFGELSDFTSATVGTTAPIETAINELVAAYADVSATADPTGKNYVSTYPNDNSDGDAGCNTPLAEIRKLTTAASDAASESGTEFKTTMSGIATSVSDTMVGMKSDISSAIDDAAKLIDDLKAQVDDTMQTSSDILLAQAMELENNPNIMSSVSFSAFNWIYLCIMAFTFGFILILLNSHTHFVEAGKIHSNPKMEGNVLDIGHVGSCGSRIGAWSWCCVFIFAAVASGLGAAFYPISKVYADVCVVIDDLPLKLGDMMGGSSSSTSPAASSRRLSGGMNVNNILETCWADGSIYDAMDMATLIPINASEMFSGFGGVPGNGALGPESKESLDALASAIDTSLEKCAAAKSALLSKLAVVNTKTDALETSIADYKLVLSTIEVNAVDVLEAQIDQIRCVKCGFLKVIWDETYGVVCKQALRAMVIFAESMVAIGFLAFWVGMLQLLILRRWGGHGPIKAHDHGDDGIQLLLTSKLEGTCGCVAQHRKKDPSGKAAEQVTATYVVDDATTTGGDVEMSAQYDQQVVDGEVEGELL